MTDELPAPKAVAPKLRALYEAWKDVDANERASFQTWFLQLCDALGVPAPTTPTGAYRFELPVKVVDREGELATNFIDAWHAGHFAMEAKMSEPGKQTDVLLRKAYGQIRNYASHVSGTPVPYLMVVDVPRTLMIWDRWSGSYGDFGAGKRIALASLHERVDEIALLQDIFARPEVRDPRGRAQVVTKEIAARLAELAAALEHRGLDQERVARFLMRCVFSCFAEDVGLLPEQLFRKTLEAARSSGDPARLKTALELLWKTMDEGGMFGAEMLHRFNGHFFKTREALPLEPTDVTLLIEATAFDWSRVEPSIFGTLLVRALDPEERHRLGAEYTPREYIERLVEPTVVEPIRERWTAVQASVLQLEETGKKKDAEQAVKALLDFHAWMRSLRFLDPACGSGNFLYVTMAAVKRIELEVLNEIQRVSGGQGGLVLDEVHPRQFFGIEIKPWAREIAELTLWIGYHQFWRETHGGRTPPDPILEDTGTIECRDAILAYDAVVHLPEKDRPDPTPRLVSPVTGELVPDPAARLPYYEYKNPRPASWPDAEFIIGNPPYLGNRRMVSAFGEGYVAALREAYGTFPRGVDLVMYWWWRSASTIASGNAVRAGLITTNSIRQVSHQPLISSAQANGAQVIYAIADHPWSGDGDSAAVRVTLTVVARPTETFVRLVGVDDEGRITSLRQSPRLNADLSIGADVPGTAKVLLKANQGLSWQGYKLVGAGFIIDAATATRLRTEYPKSDVIRSWLSGRDLQQRSRNLSVIDFGLRTQEQAAQFPLAFQIVRDHVKPERDANRDAGFREMWWRFGRPRPALRDAIRGLSRYIVTSEVSKHRVFSFCDPDTAIDGSIIAVAVEESFYLGMLSSSVHVAWAEASAGRMGVGNDSRYFTETSFDSFPFALPEMGLRTRIGEIANKIDSMRKSALARDESLTITSIYNLIAKLRAGEPLTPLDRSVHELAACGILRDLHDELDRCVAEAYGWPWPIEKDEILERLVTLHDERVEEEKLGLIRWLRPDYQIPKFATEQPATLALVDAPQATGTSGKRVDPSVATGEWAATKPPWPATAIEQISAITSLVTQRPLDAAGIIAAFTAPRGELVQRHLETLVLMGELAIDSVGLYRIIRRAS